MTTAYLGADGYADRLAQELERADVTVDLVHGRLLVSPDPPVAAAWAANTWFDAETVSIDSIADAARRLRARQRSWAAYTPSLHRRTALIADKLPPLSARPLALGDLGPASPLGSWTLVDRQTILASSDCSSVFPNGETPLSEIRVGPPNRAYRKLWEAFVVLGEYPRPGDVALDLGASPGGWTWLLAQLGCEVVAVDKAPLDPTVSAVAGVSSVQASAFGLSPDQIDEAPRWVCSDIACYPQRLLPLVERWTAIPDPPTLIFTLKFQGETDHDIIDRFKAIRGSRLVHLHHNKHELTWILPAERPSRRTTVQL